MPRSALVARVHTRPPPLKPCAPSTPLHSHCATIIIRRDAHPHSPPTTRCCQRSKNATAPASPLASHQESTRKRIHRQHTDAPPGAAALPFASAHRRCRSHGRTVGEGRAAHGPFDGSASTGYPQNHGPACLRCGAHARLSRKEKHREAHPSPTHRCPTRRRCATIREHAPRQMSQRRPSSWRRLNHSRCICIR